VGESAITRERSVSELHEPIELSEARTPFYVGIDVGGTSIKIGLVDANGRTLAFDSIETQADGPAEQAARRIGETVQMLIATSGAGAGQVARAGLASPGPIDIPSGTLVGPGNLPNWWSFPIRDRVSHHSGLPVTFANDANAAAYGEFWRGAGQQHESMILLTMGTGIGGGIIIGDLIVDGAHGCGSECGHILIDPRDDARADSLGKTGSLEAYCGAYAVVARAEEALASGHDSVLGKDGNEVTPLVIAQAAAAGDELARHIVLETARYMGIGIVSLIHTIDPDSVVLGGAMTFGGAGHPLGEEFLDEVRREARRRMLAPLRDRVAIEFATLGAAAGYVGAAGLARREHRRSVV
jgi:glucokinase